MKTAEEILAEVRRLNKLFVDMVREYPTGQHQQTHMHGIALTSMILRFIEDEE